MEFRIADTFADSLARLTGDEQKAAKTTAFDLQINLASPGLSFHKLEKAKDSRFWSVRVNRDIRLIVHRDEGSLLLCYVDHHDKAYAWAERRKLERHPTTGAAQLVEIRETLREIVVPVYVQGQLAPTPSAPAPSEPLFRDIADEDLLRYGVPQEWLADVRLATTDSLLALADHLPAEAAEALLELATGGKPRAPEILPPTANPFEHPDAQRRFRVMTDVDELARALEYPWDKWTVFLHPEQRQLVERSYSGPARVSGSAGTGKTIVALHRAAYLARANSDSRVLLTTLTDTLANALRVRLRRLLGDEPRLAERIDVHSLTALALRLYRTHVGEITLAGDDSVRTIVAEAGNDIEGHRFSAHFLESEWQDVVDAWQLRDWDDYRDVIRLGRKTRLPEARRAELWKIFELAEARLHERGLTTPARMFTELAERLTGGKVLFDHVVLDEAQDLSVAQLRFVAALTGGRPDAAFFAGDIGQRIFQQPFSWKSLGVDVRGRSYTLRVNYRTSHQIRSQADRLLGEVLTDVDGMAEVRSGTVSVFNGPAPLVVECQDEETESRAVGKWLTERLADGVLPHEIGIFVRSSQEIGRARAAVAVAGTKIVALDDRVEPGPGRIAVSTMHLAKGLEFRAVAVIACDDEVIPLQSRIENVGDDADLQEVYETERHLLYVACTRARDHLMVSGVEPVSEFLDDFQLSKTFPVAATWEEKPDTALDNYAPDDRPSATFDTYWLFAEAPRTAPGKSGAGGKWLIFASKGEIDALWARVAIAVRAGLLGPEAKVSTRKPNPNSQNTNRHVICVYTGDADDADDVMRVRGVLRTLGVRSEISYKTDEATSAGQYANRGATGIARYRA